MLDTTKIVLDYVIQELEKATDQVNMQKVRDHLRDLIILRKMYGSMYNWEWTEKVLPVFCADLITGEEKKEEAENA